MRQYSTLGQAQPHNSSCHILMNFIDIHLQTHNHQYGMPLDFPLTILDATQSSPSTHLMIPCPSGDPTKIPKAPLRRTTQNPHARKYQNYNIVDDLA